LPELKLASLLDMELLEIAQKEAEQISLDDPMLEKPEHAYLRQRVTQFWESAPADLG
jgi:hypothetical protein